MMMKRIKVETQVSAEAGVQRSDSQLMGTPNKSLNASFSRINVFNSNFYGGPPGVSNSRLNLSNFLYEHRNSQLFGLNPLAGHGLSKQESDVQRLPSMTRNLSLPFGQQPPDNGANFLSYKSGIYDMQELFHHLDMGGAQND